MLRSRTRDADDRLPSIHAALRDAADQVGRRRRILRGALIGFGGAVILVGVLILGGPI